MADSMKYRATEPYVSADQVNREIAQEAQTDREMEAIVPPVSKNGTVWRIAVAVVLLLGLLTAVVFMA